MFSFIIGVVAALTVVGIFSRRAFGRRVQRRFLDWRLERFLDRIDATDEQREVIEDIAEDLRAELDESRHQLKFTRLGVGELFRASRLEDRELRAALEPGREALERAGAAIASSFGRLHAVLSPKQRADIADWLGRCHRNRRVHV